MITNKFTFEDLKIYQKALVFIDEVYKVSSNFPQSERFSLTSQFQRASTSIVLNIAEGSADTDKQFYRFLQIALGSINECVVCATIAEQQHYISEEKENELRQALAELSKMITSLKSHLTSKITSNL